jgi:hypothetical protein
MPESVVYVTPAEVAARFRWTEREVRNRRARGQGPPFVRLGRRTVRYRLADLLAWEQAQEHGPAPIGGEAE